MEFSIQEKEIKTNSIIDWNKKTQLIDCMSQESITLFLLKK